MRFSKLISLTLVVLLYHGVKAQNTASTTIGLNHILPINSSDHFETIRIIDRDELKMLNALTLKEVLEFELLFDIDYTSNKGYQVKNQGLNERYIKVLRNGVSVYPELFSKIRPEQISLVGVVRIEVLLAPGGIYNGSGSVGCVINLVTEHFQKDTTLTVIKATLSNQLSLQNSVNTALVRTRHSVTATAGRTFNTGFQGRDSGRVSQFAPFEQLYYSINYQYKLLPGLNLQLSRNFVQHYTIYKDYPIGNSVRAYDLANEHKSTQNTAKLIGKASKVHLFEISLNHNRISDDFLRYRRNLVDLRKIYEPVSDPFDSIKLAETHLWAKIARENPSFKLNYDAGISLKFTQDKNRPFINGIRTSTTQYSAYARAFYSPVDELTIAGGLKWLTSNNFAPLILPELKLRYQVNKDFRWSLGYYTSYRVPDFGQLHYLTPLPEFNSSAKGNLNLNIERSAALFTGFEFKQKHVKVMSSFQLNSITNAVSPSLIINDSLRTWANPARIRSLSNTFMVQVDQRLFTLKTGLAIVGQNTIAHQIDQFQFYPQWNNRINVKIKNVTLALFAKYTGKRSFYAISDEGEIVRSSDNSLWLMDFTMNTHVKPWTVQLGLKNILNVYSGTTTIESIDKRSQILDQPNIQDNFYSPGRQVYFSLTYSI